MGGEERKCPKMLRRRNEPNLIWLGCEYKGEEELETGILVDVLR